MNGIPRRSFLQLALAVLASSRLMAQSPNPQPTSAQSPGPETPPEGTQNAERKAVLVTAGSDRENRKHVIGVSSSTYKVLTAESGGALFVLEQANQKRGGPTRHFHYSQDELFYVMEGEYIVEIGADRFHLKAGDCVLGPRKIPHAWAFVGETTGRMVISFAPAGRMEEFFNDREKLGIKPGEYAKSSEADVMRAYGMEHVGPPIKID